MFKLMISFAIVLCDELFSSGLLIWQIGIVETLRC